MAITREQVIKTALEILDQYGLADLTMRRLASQLGVQAGALYWHFSNKQTLLDALGGKILSDLSPICSGNWESTIKTWAAKLYESLRKNRSGAELVSGVLALRPWQSSPGYKLQEYLVKTGFDTATAQAAAAGIVHMVLGHTAQDEQQAQLAQLGLLNSGPDTASSRLLEEAVSMLITGLKPRLSGNQG